MPNKTRKRYGKKVKGGNACQGVLKESLISGGGKKYKKSKSRRVKSRRRKSMKYRKTMKKRRMKGGAFHGYDVLSLSGVESASIPIVTQVVKGRQYRLSGAPLDQPINNKYGDHNPPLV
jgi:hypothetical protein|tara:strand:- start:332 stop:688 length:357 start_codon:yes stop_codon:yes gene_type:complete